MRCLGGVQDDLHDYAEEVNERLAEILALKPLSVAEFGNFNGAVLNRLGGVFQAELITLPPGAALPAHFHPNVDSVDLLVEGNISAFFICEQRISRFVKGMGLRIPAHAAHGGQASAAGVAFVSCQRWKVPASHVGLDWIGKPSTPEHRRLLYELAGIQ